MLQKCVNLLTKHINNDRIGEQDVTKPYWLCVNYQRGFYAQFNVIQSISIMERNRTVPRK